jgi:DNA-binding NarL/FixJ family response regulator
MIRVVIVEDDRPTREGFLKILRHSQEINCLGACASAEQIEQEISKLLPDVVLMDVNMPGRSGIECVASLKKSYPKIEFVMITTYDDAELIFEALRVGASGYLLKDTTAGELIKAIIDVYRGGSPMSMQIARRVVTHFRRTPQSSSEIDELTKRESEILGLLAEGLPYKQIASQLEISRSTVHNHLHAIYKKLHVQTRTQAVVKFMRK